MIDPEFLRLLRCPVTGELLHVASPELLARLNKLIAEQRITNHVGIALQSPLAAALVNASRTFAYAIVNESPWLIPSEAIRIKEIHDLDE